MQKKSCRYLLPIEHNARKNRRGSSMVALEKAMVVSYRLSIVTVALFLTIRPQFAIECLRRSNQQGSLWG